VGVRPQLISGAFASNDVEAAPSCLRNVVEIIADTLSGMMPLGAPDRRSALVVERGSCLAAQNVTVGSLSPASADATARPNSSSKTYAGCVV
jgi:hypothetical protein